MKSTQSVIEKVKKLLNTDGRTQEEVQAFLAAAQSLMLKHGLSSTDVEVSTQDNDSVEQWHFEKSTKGIPTNISLLAAALSKPYRVISFRTRTTSGTTIKIIGDPTDVAIFVEVFQYCLTMQDKLVKEFLKENKGKTRSESIANKNQFLAGFRTGLRNSLTENSKELGLVIIVKDAVMKQVEAMSLTNFKSSYTISGNTSHRNAGFDAGSTVLSRKNNLQ